MDYVDILELDAEKVHFNEILGAILKRRERDILLSDENSPKDFLFFFFRGPLP